MASSPPTLPRPTLAEVASFLSGQLVGPPETVLSGVSNLEQAGSGDLSFVAGDRFLQAASHSEAAALLVGRLIPDCSTSQILVPHPALAFARVVQHFFCAPYRATGIVHPIAQGSNVRIGSDVSLGPFVTLGDNVTIGARVTLSPGVYVGSGAEIGEDSLLYPNVVVREDCRIGRRVVIHSGTVIGSDGFGYVQHQGQHVKVPQLGGVTIEDDVEIGANVTVDRATFGQTLIRRGTKIDNLVQIAHNVQIGEHCIVVAQVGIAGSTAVGTHVMIGGQAGLADHLQVGDRVMIAARSGVNRSVAADQIVSGAPAMPHETALRAQALLPHLPELRQQLRELHKRVERMESESKKPSPRKAAIRRSRGRKR